MKFRIIASLLFLLLLGVAYLIVESNSYSTATPTSSGDGGYVIR